MENDWNVEWNLDLPVEKAEALLREMFQAKGYRTLFSKWKIASGQFESTALFSYMATQIFREYIHGKGAITEMNNGSHFSAAFSIAFPYKCFNLDRKHLWVIIPLSVLSWIGLLLNMVLFRYINLDMPLILIFFATIGCLVFGFMKYYIVDERFKNMQSVFTQTFSKHIVEESPPNKT